MNLQLPFVLLALIEASLLLIAPYLAGAALPAASIFALFSLASLFAVGLYSTRQRCSPEGVVVRVVAAPNSRSIIFGDGFQQSDLKQRLLK